MPCTRMGRVLPMLVCKVYNREFYFYCFTDGTRAACPDAYGMVLGTSLICAFLEIGMSFVPPRVLQRIFPPMVTGKSQHKTLHLL